MEKLKAAIILDNLSLSKWHLLALNEAMHLLDIKLVLNCENTKNKKRIFRHFLYYFINLFSLKNHLTKKVDFDTPGDFHVLSFESIYKGIWQSIPSEIVKKSRMLDIDVIIKFGMGLLKIDDNLFGLPILSYHHGDPSKYRGRPAGFYEILNNDSKCGVIVQSLTNNLDAGEIYAFAEAKVVDYSYRKTALNFYSISPFLLKKAILNLMESNPVRKSKNGRNYTLPTNLVVALFLSKILTNLTLRLLYGLFYEKRWHIAISDKWVDFHADNLLKEETLNAFPVGSNYNFYADPFFSADCEKVRLEALDSVTGLGDIIEFDINSFKDYRVLLGGNHYSYPYSFQKDENEFLLPEVASHSNQYFCRISYGQNGAELSEPFYLKGLENKRIVDATLIQHETDWYLFFGESANAHTILHLWCSNSLEKNFIPHPKSPICISPSSARMGGKLIFHDEKIYRIGQNNSRGYGESITITEISCLSREDFKESVSGTISIDNKKGPHTFDFDYNSKRILVDYYADEFSIFSGIRRLKAKLSKK